MLKSFGRLFHLRHIGPSQSQISEMLKTCQSNSVSELVSEVIGKSPGEFKQLQLGHSKSEKHSLETLQNAVDQNVKAKSFIGLGYYNTILPPPIKRHILENPKWYTPYTPYQAEISQGRLESQYNFQTLVSEMTSLPIANASLLDEGSASVEVMNLSTSYFRNKKRTFICSDRLPPHVLNVLKTHAEFTNLDLKILDLSNLSLNKHFDPSIILNDDVSGIMFSYPDTTGEISLNQSLIQRAKEKEILVSCSTDLLALTKLKPPGELGFDISFGNSQRFGVPLWYGGPHPAFFSCRSNLIRHVPGRIISKAKDVLGTDTYRLGLQTREQHIRKEKATSNICTSQSLLTNVVSMYAIYHGPEGLSEIATGIHQLTNQMKLGLTHMNYHVVNGDSFFDTLTVVTPSAKSIHNALKEKRILINLVSDDQLSISMDENSYPEDLKEIFEVFQEFSSVELDLHDLEKFENLTELNIPEAYQRKSSFLEQDVFNMYHTEPELVRYMYSLADKDYTLCDGMFPLGSCTMKLNGSVQLEALTWEKISNVHPFVPPEYVAGYQIMIEKVGEYLKEITGFSDVSFQTNSGSMGEYTGLLCIKKYHQDRGESRRNVCLIPKSAHGTNFASARKAGLKAVSYNDLKRDDFDRILEKYQDDIAAIMITYPGTNGIFQDDIKEVTSKVHEKGGLVYIDGANMNALVGLTTPAEVGGDVCHLNLHKTFCIPHGGGGPGMGPILCNKKLEKYLPQNPLQIENINQESIGNVTSSQWSSASLLSIPYIYIMSMGEKLQDASMIAILNANYLKDSLKDDYTIIDLNKNGRVGHEFIIDLSNLKVVSEFDIAKRLIDYNFHPPTIAWPRLKVLMFEPTESESKTELDRLVTALKEIKKEILEVENGEYSKDNNVLVNAPHTLRMIPEWDYPYSIKKAFYPVPSLMDRKRYPACGRVDDSSSDRELLNCCS